MVGALLLVTATEIHADFVDAVVVEYDDAFVAGLIPLVRTIQNTGATTLEAIACALNERGVRPARGTRWYVSSVSNLLSRAQKLVDVRR